MTETWKNLRNSFFAGLLVVLPAAASVLILVWLFTWVTDFMLPEVLRKQMFTPLYRVIALVVFVALTMVVGWVTRMVMGRKIVTLTEAIIAHVPLLNKLYGFVKEISETVLSGHKTTFQRVVLVQLTRSETYTLAFVTSEKEWEAQAKTKQVLMNVFILASPPTHGYVISVPRDQVIELDISVADAMKMVISGGTVGPSHEGKTQPPAPPGTR
jgi:uncharacterized membrane protein